MNVVNLSIGGPDYLDLPFVEKVSPKQKSSSAELEYLSALCGPPHAFSSLLSVDISGFFTHNPVYSCLSDMKGIISGIWWSFKNF